ncbi:hypothetical protein QI297_13110 [Staphylococcus saprophyticus]|nr:hypothetical protein [Staphylococcus saprophyticus]
MKKTCFLAITILLVLYIRNKDIKNLLEFYDIDVDTDEDIDEEDIL